MNDRSIGGGGDTPDPSPIRLSQEQRRTLLELARETLQARLTGAPLPVPVHTDGILDEPRGAFVTLTIDGQLRGCIGHLAGIVPLWQSVCDNAQAAALADPRFPPLQKHELDRIRIEISVLSPMAPIDPSDVAIGVHGLMVEHGCARGLLLPQVAPEQGWDRWQLLDATCRKAGLPAAAWRESGTVLQAFTAEVFGEAPDRLAARKDAS